VEDIAKRHGAAGLIRLIADIAMRMPMEYLSEMRGDRRKLKQAMAEELMCFFRTIPVRNSPPKGRCL
jgi:hypothetical protein